MKNYTTWFKYAVWLGIIQDWALGIPAIFAPNWLLGLVGQRLTLDPVWTSFAGLLVVLLSLSYIPGANAPRRYPISAWLSALSRPPGVVFFFLLYPNVYPLFGIVDSVLCLIQIPLLLLVMSDKSNQSALPVAAAQTIPGKSTDQDIFEYDGSTFQEIHDVGFENPYAQLPFHPGVTVTKLIQLFNDGARNLFDRRDIRPYYDKLIHANGFCATGIWKINADTPYSGYFSKGSEGLVFARLSVAASRLNSGQKRALGIAGKIYPTLNPQEKFKPANFVAIDYLTGIVTKHITDTDMTNFPDVGPDPGAILVNRIMFRLLDKRPGYRQLFPISTLGLKPGETVVTPDLMMLRITADMPKIDAVDFRDELRLENYPNHTLVYEINVRNFNEPEWQQIGTLSFNEYCICEGCDKRIHFWIPRDIPVPEREELARPVLPDLV
jgi:hypothetical protein